jgi:hypothetical protein
MEDALTRTPACGDVRRELGVYVLGAIAAADRSSVDGHLECCAACRDELAGLAGLPALLGRVPVDDVDSLVLAVGDELPPDRLGLLLDRAAGRRRLRTWHWLTAGVVVALLAGGGAVAASRMMHPARYDPADSANGSAAHQSAVRNGGVTVRASNPATQASAVVKYVAEPWGIELLVQVTGVPVGTRCEFEVTNAAGQRSAAGSWTVAAGHQGAWYPASSSVSLLAARSFVVAAGTRALVTVSVPAAPTQTGDRG